MEQKKFEYNEISYDEKMGMNSYQSSMNNSCDSNMQYMQPQQSMMCQPIQECPQERVCHRYICYEVPHIMPCNTRIINHHIYKHTYTPCYTSCEENVCENIYGPRCC